MGQGNRWQLNRWIASCWLPHFKIAFGISHFNNIRWGSAVLLLQCQDFQLRTVAHLLTPCFEKFPLRLSSGRELGWKTCFLIFSISHRDIRGCRNHQPVFWMQYMRSHFQMLSHGEVRISNSNDIQFKEFMSFHMFSSPPFWGLHFTKEMFRPLQNVHDDSELLWSL